MSTGSAPELPRIVVGVDGSPSAHKALVWALDQARSTGAGVEAVMAWDIPITYGTPTMVLPYEDLAKSARATLAAQIDEAAADFPRPRLSQRVVRGHPAHVLTELAEGADLLVVGSHGHGTFARALLGSVGHHCVQHAPCPVVVVR
ncbi:universal stress protein [Nocardiopsis suaedae]|uniref:Universal stress protein n=1 Tax=Nocardiopsis suaedae TaxID=3018444 RepID=A0ABT4TP60_9ACTN|nr:universal stress protein [Nocardiopsis suaedae]MDA2806471.1 universal stress protein [Nocardiopsis suaedae]